MKKIYTTQSVDEYPTINFEEMQKAIDLLEASMPKKILERIELCKKHYKKLVDKIPKAEPNNSMGIIGELGSVSILVKPYLKKVKMIYRNLK